MARKALAKDQIVKLIVGAGQASPSPPLVQHWVARVSRVWIFARQVAQYYLNKPFLIV